MNAITKTTPDKANEPRENGGPEQKPDNGAANDNPAPKEEKFSADLLRGADQIADFIYGSAEHRRKIYYLAENCNLPIFRLGAVLCARKSVLLKWISDQEKRGWRV